MRRNAAIALTAAAGAALGALLASRRRSHEAPPRAADERTRELRRKLAEARAATADEEDFEAAGMGAETVVEEPPRGDAPTETSAPQPEEPAVPAPPEPPPPPRPEPSRQPPSKPDLPTEPPPADEFEAMRRRIHEEGRAAAEEMRRSGEPPDKG